MDISKNVLSASNYFILNKQLVKEFGLETTIVLHEFSQREESNNTHIIKKKYYLNILKELSTNTSLPLKKIKNVINRLYTLKFIDVIVNKKEDGVYIKILHQNIANKLIKNYTKTTEKQIKQKPKGIISKQSKFKKPLKKELNEYFHELGDTENSTMFYDYYESNGWKVGRNPMKCWKSAARNWLKRSNLGTSTFPNHYDENTEKKIKHNRNQLLKYHQHLKKLGWISSYSPTSGTKWHKKNSS